MVKGRTNSCGCLHRERAERMQWKHGAARRGGKTTKEYRAWMNAKNRCFYSSNAAFANYGGRGIVMCEEWRHDLPTFLRDMGPCPPKHTLDRWPDNDGNYEPGNCRWATRTQQMRNMRSNRLIAFNGESLTLMEWAERVGISHKSLSGRLDSWSIEKALTEPPRRRT